MDQSTRIQRFVGILSIPTFFISTISTSIVVVQAWNPTPRIFSVSLPREAIGGRYNKIVYTILELIIFVIYIGSLTGVLRSPAKSSVRQRRFMLDLIYVNTICVASDVVSVVSVYLSQNQPSIQTFNHAFKIRLNFVLLN